MTWNMLSHPDLLRPRTAADMTPRARRSLAPRSGSRGVLAAAARVLPLLALLTACDAGFADPSREFAEPIADTVPYRTTIRMPTSHGVVDTPLRDVHGTPIGVACETCHGPNPSEAWTATPGDSFHTGVELKHGTLTCDFCHTEDRLAFRLADGSRLERGASMKLCGQCHGPQLRDYDAGAHGGMSGYWDLRQGPRVRNHCTACHAPHSPAYERVMPVHPPRDRYLDTTPANARREEH